MDLETLRQETIGFFKKRDLAGIVLLSTNDGLMSHKSFEANWNVLKDVEDGLEFNAEQGEDELFEEYKNRIIATLGFFRALQMGLTESMDHVNSLVADIEKNIKPLMGEITGEIRVEDDSLEDKERTIH